MVVVHHHHCAARRWQWTTKTGDRSQPPPPGPLSEASRPDKPPATPGRWCDPIITSDATTPQRTRWGVAHRLTPPRLSYAAGRMATKSPFCRLDAASLSFSAQAVLRLALHARKARGCYLPGWWSLWRALDTPARTWGGPDTTELASLTTTTKAEWPAHADLIFKYRSTLRF